MNYKYLSKYHYIYRLSIGGDRKAHVEKLPIAYSNQHYVYIIEPGSDHLKELSLAPTGSYFRGVIYTKLDQTIKERIANYLIDEFWANRSYGGIVGRQLWFLLDDPNELQKFTEELSWLLNGSSYSRTFTCDGSPVDRRADQTSDLYLQVQASIRKTADCEVLLQGLLQLAPAFSSSN